MTPCPSSTSRRAASSGMAPRCMPPRSTGIWPLLRKSQPATGTLKRDALVRNRGARPSRQTPVAMSSGSTLLWWFGARMNGPVAGSRSPCRTRTFAAMRMNGGTMSASTQNMDGRRVSAWGVAPAADGRVRSSAIDREARPQRLQLGGEVLVPPTDDADVPHGRGALRGQRRDEVREPAPQVWDLDVRAVQRRRTRDDGGLLEVPPRHAPRGVGEPVRVHDDVGAHLLQRL